MNLLKSHKISGDAGYARYARDARDVGNRATIKASKYLMW